jgi:hypothetical protein
LAPERETHKSSFYDLLISKKVFTLASIAFADRLRFPSNPRDFKETYMELKEVNQIQTHNLYENLERFKEENKVQFSKWETSLIGRNEGGQDENYNSLIREVLSAKLLREEFRFRVLSESVRLIRA